MFCKNCGQEIKENEAFCRNCGAKICIPQDTQSAPTPHETKLNQKILWIGVLVVIGIAAIISAVLLLSGSSNRANFNIEYSASGVEKFLNVVCKNVDAEYAKVVDPNYDGPAGNSCYTAVVEIKQKGRVAEESQMRFYNYGDSDMVSYGEVYFRGTDSMNQFECERQFVIALEKTLCGKSYVQEYIKDYEPMEVLAHSIDEDEKTIAEYWLTDDLKVVISYESGLSREWRFKYRIMKR